MNFVVHGVYFNMPAQLTACLATSACRYLACNPASMHVVHVLLRGTSTELLLPIEPGMLFRKIHLSKSDGNALNRQKTLKRKSKLPVLNAL